MRNLIALAALCLATSVHGFSKYGRTCKDIGCLGSEVCILAEDPCTIGHATDCGTYPTCKKKSLVDGGGTNAEPAKPAAPAPRPVYPSPPRNDEAPNYPPPPPPRSNYPSIPSYGGGSGGYGGSSGGYGGGNGGYGGSNGGYGGSNGGYGGSNGGYGGSSGGYGGSNGGYGGNTGNRGGSLPSGGGNNPLSSLFNGLTGGGGSGAGGSNPNGGFVSSFFNNVLNNFTRNGGLSGLSGLLSPSNTRPIVENPYYQNPNQRAGANYPNNPSYSGYPGYNGYQQQGGYNPSYSQPGSQQTGYVAKNYGQSHAVRNGATTRKPASYGWNLGMSLVCLMAFLGATHR